LSRPPLSEAALRRALLAGDLWREIKVVETTGSTNADITAAARNGEPEGLVLVAEQQTAGRGRLDRAWEAPPRSGLTFSALLRPTVGLSAWGPLPLLAGLAAIEALVSVGGVESTLKWPNDVMLGGRKLGGVLVEVVGGAAVVGMGINVSMRQEELPVETAVSLLIAEGGTDRQPLLLETLRALARRYRVWSAAGGDPAAVMPAYRERCETIGAVVELLLPNGDVVRGRATDVDDAGRLVVSDDDTGEARPWTVGDVTHVRVG
jgi:BirA family biotin operon repressor/biotin-[acetyl-CoA-carboxylase] ligase